MIKFCKKFVRKFLTFDDEENAKRVFANILDILKHTQVFCKSDHKK